MLIFPTSLIHQDRIRRVCEVIRAANRLVTAIAAASRFPSLRAGEKALATADWQPKCRWMI
jgi:hypothetical protein